MFSIETGERANINQIKEPYNKTTKVDAHIQVLDQEQRHTKLQNILHLFPSKYQPIVNAIHCEHRELDPTSLPKPIFSIDPISIRQLGSNVYATLEKEIQLPSAHLTLACYIQIYYRKMLEITSLSVEENETWQLLEFSLLRVPVYSFQEEEELCIYAIYCTGIRAWQKRQPRNDWV
ncbi:hypothetical protein RUND412_010701 [Rhizina undulata]